MVGATEPTTVPGPAQVIDLRGLRAPADLPSVLADPTGRRARRLRVAGRIVGSLLLLWLCGLVLAGLGLLPVSDVPLAGTFRPADEPAKISPATGGAHARNAHAGAALTNSFGSAGTQHPAGRAARGDRVRGRAPASTHGSRDHGAAESRHDGAASRHGGHTGGSGSGGAGGSAPAASSGSHGSAHSSPVPSSSPTTSNGVGAGGTPPASGSGTTHGQSAVPHGASSTAPGRTRTSPTGHGPPSG